ncbi:MAG: hypothetical protein EP343_30975 [Deltaproteobacteria bacterium]|nr:MAG: hypothetical protein EP343_30975 [Deltaproteobacteria bacterium]
MQRSRWVPLWLCAVVLLGVSLGANHARAADVEQAVRSYQQGFSAFSQKQYNVAIQKFKNARRLLPSFRRYDKTRVELDRLIGVSYYHLRKFQKAYSLLDNYLRSPSRRKSKVPAVRKLWLELRSRLGLSVKKPVKRRDVPIVRRVTPPIRTRVIPPRRNPPPIQRRAGGPHPGAWAIAGIGLATLGAAVAVGILAQQNMNTVQERYSRLAQLPERNASAISEGTREALTQSTVANALYVGGGVFVATGTVLLFTWKQAPPKAP